MRNSLIKRNHVSIRASKRKAKLKHQVHFLRINTESEHFSVVKQAFKKILEPIYGCQNTAIQKLANDGDRYCELMFSGDNPLGILIYKRKLQKEYGIVNGLELKTLFLLAPEKNSGKGLGSLLYRRIEEIAKEMGTDIIFCTASEKSQQSMKCAVKNGFRIVRSLKIPSEKIQEYLLVKKV